MNKPIRLIIDGLQYANYSEKIFKQMRVGGVDAVHVTITYHENFRETVLNIEKWNRWFEKHSDLILHGKFASDIELAKKSQRTAIFFGLQNCSPIEDDIGLVEILHTLGVRFMQLTYNNQSLLASGCFEENDNGISRMGREVITEMNRVGMVIDMSHSGARSTIQAIELSKRPIAITHANPSFWHPALRNKDNEILKALAQSGGILGVSLYPHHLKNGTSCSIESFCQMIEQTVELMGINHVAIGSDLCQDQPDSVVHWMRNGRWTKKTDYGEGNQDNVGFPDQPSWFTDNTCFLRIAEQLKKQGFAQDDVERIIGQNWFDFFQTNFTPAKPIQPAISFDET